MYQQFIVLFKDSAAVTVPAGVFLGTLIAGMLLRKSLFDRLSKLAERSATPFDDIIIRAARGPFLIWCAMAGMYFALAVSSLPDGAVHIVNKALFVAGAFSVTLVAATIASNLIHTYSSKIGSTLPITSLTRNTSRIIIFGVGILMILNGLGISITPMLATLGVGGLAVALALQGTLSNLFSGFHIMAERQIRVGDYIKLESGEEGYVEDMTWRTTKIRMLPNNEVLVPNEKLTKAIIVNYYLPDKEMAVLVQVGVHYGSDLEVVERVTCEVAREVMREVSGGVREFEPFIRYHTFGDFSINFTVILRAGEVVDQYLIKHEFIKRLHKRYAKEGIVIPYPIRAINYDQEKAG